MHLYELAEEAVALEELCAMDQGEWTDEHETLAQDLSAKLVAKADAFGGYLKSLEGRAATIKEEETRLAARRKALTLSFARIAAQRLHGLWDP